MGNILPRPAIKLRARALCASVLSLHHVGSLMSPLYQHVCLCSFLPESSVQTTRLLISSATVHREHREAIALTQVRFAPR